MASTKKIKTVISNDEKSKVDEQVKHLIVQLEQKLDQYNRYHGQQYPIQLKEIDEYDYINPSHYVQGDGRQTWEHMIDEFGEFETAVFCKLNAYKYADRIGKKPNEDVEREKKKIQWYEDKAIELFQRVDGFNDENTWTVDGIEE